MAQINISTYYYAVNFELSFTTVSQSIENNTSQVRVLGRLIGTGNGEYGTATTGSVTFNGTSYSFNATSYSFPNGSSVNKVLFDQTFTVAHGADGKKTVSGSMVWNHGSTAFKTAYVQETVALATIPRYTSITSLTSSSVHRSGFTISFSTANTIDQWAWQRKEGSGAYGSWNYISGNRTSGSQAFSGLKANTTYTINVGVRRKDSQLWTYKTIAVKTLAIASPNTPTLSSRTAIQVVFNWSANRTVTNVQYKRWSSDAWQSAGADFSARTSGSVTINGLSPNTGYSIYVRVKDAVHGTWSGSSGALSVTTYALSTITGSNTTVDTSAKSFAISKAVSSMSQDVTLQMWADSQKWIDIKSWTNTNGGGFALTASEVSLIQTNRTGSNTLAVRYQCTTRWGSGGTVQGTTYSPQYTWTLVDVNPTLDSATYKDAHSNTDFVAWKGGDQKILRNSSLLQVTLGKANAIKGAKLVKYVLTIAGKQYTTNATSGATEQAGAIINAGIVNAGTNQTATIEVFDTRGNKVTRTLTVQMVDYYPPQLIYGTGERLNSYEQPTYLNFLARYSRIIVGGVDVNELTAQYRIKVKGNADSTYGGFVDIVAPKGSVNGIWQEVSSSQFMQNLDENTIYTMHIQYKDYVVGWRNYYVDIEMGVGLMEFFEDRIEIGVRARFNEGMEVDGPAEFKKGIVVPDTRDVVSVPEELPGNAVSFDFKNNSSVGNPPVTASTTYSHIINVAGWSSSDGSGGWPTQISVGGSGLAVRQATSATAWGPWTAVGGAGSVAWSAITGKPSTFAPSSHNHSGTTTTGTQTTHTTAHGYIQLGPMNTSAAHIYSNRGPFYMNQDLMVANGKQVWHAGNMSPKITALWSGNASSTGTRTMTSRSGYDFLIVMGFMDQGSSENLVSVTIPVATISTNARRYSLSISYSSSNSYVFFSFPSATQFRIDNIYGGFIENIQYIYGVKIT